MAGEFQFQKIYEDSKPQDNQNTTGEVSPIHKEAYPGTFSKNDLRRFLNGTFDLNDENKDKVVDEEELQFTKDVLNPEVKPIENFKKAKDSTQKVYFDAKENSMLDFTLDNYRAIKNLSRKDKVSGSGITALDIEKLSSVKIPKATFSEYALEATDVNLTTIALLSTGSLKAAKTFWPTMPKQYRLPYIAATLAGSTMVSGLISVFQYSRQRQAVDNLYKYGKHVP